MALVGEAEVVITANTAGFESQLKTASSSSLGTLEKNATVSGETAGKNLEKGMSGPIAGIKSMLGGLGIPESLMSGAALGAVAIGGMAAAAVDMGMKMQKADASIAASSGVSMKAATDIGNAFLSTAGKTEFSGQTMATAFAGVAGQLKSANGAALTTKQSLDFMNASSTLATAKGIDLKTATSTLAATMQAFQIPMKGASDATNVLFNVSNATGTSIDTVGQQLDKLRAKLGATAPPLGQLGTLMVDMTNNGITGRASLTAVSGAMTTLVAAATGATKAGQASADTLKAYGLSAVDAQGKLTPMSTLIEGLAPKYATMTQAQQLATSTTIFGSAAAKGMTAVIDAGTASYTKASDAVTKNNNVQNAAEIQSHTLAVEFETVKASLVDFATKLGGMLIPALQGLMKVVIPVLNGLMGIVGWFEKGSAPALAIAGIIAATLVPAIVRMGISATTSAAESIAAFATMGNGIGGFGAKVVATDATIEAANATAGKSFLAMLGPIGLVLAAAGAATVATQKLNSMNASKPWYDKLDPASLIASGVGALAHQVDKINPLVNHSPTAASSVGGSHDPLGRTHTGLLTAATDLSNVAKGPLTNAATNAKDAYIASTAAATKGASTSSSSTVKMNAEQLAMQTQGTAALNAELNATHSKSFNTLNTALNKAHTDAMQTLVTKLDATHNTTLTALASKITTDYHNMETAKNAILTADSKTASTALNAQLNLTTSTSMTALNTGLNATHNKALVVLENQLDATHNKNLIALSTQLVKTHKEALDNWAAQALIVEANAYLAAAQGKAGISALQETVNQDKANMGLLTGDALLVAQDQLALDQQKLADAQTEANLTGAALTNYQAQATINDQNLQNVLDWQTNLKSIDDAAAAFAVTYQNDLNSTTTSQGQLKQDYAAWEAAVRNAAAAAAIGPAQASLPPVPTAVVPTSTAATAISQGLQTTMTNLAKDIAAEKAHPNAANEAAVKALTSRATTMINVAAGAVVIHPAPGNDAASLAATDRMITAAFNQLGTNLASGVNPLSPVGV